MEREIVGEKTGNLSFSAVTVGIACSGLGDGGPFTCMTWHQSHSSLGFSFITCQGRGSGRRSQRLMSGNLSTRALFQEALGQGKGQGREGGMQKNVKHFRGQGGLGNVLTAKRLSVTLASFGPLEWRERKWLWTRTRKGLSWRKWESGRHENGGGGGGGCCLP